MVGQPKSANNNFFSLFRSFLSKNDLSRRRRVLYIWHSIDPARFLFLWCALPLISSRRAQNPTVKAWESRQSDDEKTIKQKKVKKAEEVNIQIYAVGLAPAEVHILKLDRRHIKKDDDFKLKNPLK